MDQIYEHLFEGITLSSVLKDKSVMGVRERIDRRHHGLLIKLSGVTEYRSDDNSWVLTPGKVLFVPQGSDYSVREVEPGESCVVNFFGKAPSEIVQMPVPEKFDVGNLAEKMCNYFDKGNRYGAMSCLYQMLEKTLNKRNYSPPQEKQQLEPVMAYLEEHLTDPDLNVGKLADLMGVSDAYLRRIFKKQQEISPVAYVVRERLRIAKRMLREEEKSISQIAAEVGYTDALYFSRLFKKQLGIAPTEYRRTRRQERF